MSFTFSLFSIILITFLVNHAYFTFIAGVTTTWYSYYKKDWKKSKPTEQENTNFRGLIKYLS